MKTYQLFYAECAVVEAKVRLVEGAKLKFETENPKKVPNSRKYKSLEKEYEKRFGEIFSDFFSIFKIFREIR